MPVTLYCDYRYNKNKGQICYIRTLKDSNKVMNWGVESYINTTEERLSLLSVIFALSEVKKDDHITVYMRDISIPITARRIHYSRFSLASLTDGDLWLQYIEASAYKHVEFRKLKSIGACRIMGSLMDNNEDQPIEDYPQDISMELLICQSTLFENMLHHRT